MQKFLILRSLQGVGFHRGIQILGLQKA